MLPTPSHVTNEYLPTKPMVSKLHSGDYPDAIHRHQRFLIRGTGYNASASDKY